MSQLRTIARSIKRADRRPPWDWHNQPAHMMRVRAFNAPLIHPVPLDPDGLPSEHEATVNRQSRNAAKGLRRDRRFASRVQP